MHLVYVSPGNTAHAVVPCNGWHISGDGTIRRYPWPSCFGLQLLGQPTALCPVCEMHREEMHAAEDDLLAEIDEGIRVGDELLGPEDEDTKP